MQTKLITSLGKILPIMLRSSMVDARGMLSMLKEVRNMQRDLFNKAYRAQARKDFQIGVRVTEDEYNYIRAQSRRMNITMSALMRYLMLQCIEEVEMPTKTTE